MVSIYAGLRFLTPTLSDSADPWSITNKKTLWFRERTLGDGKKASVGQRQQSKPPAITSWDVQSFLELRIQSVRAIWPRIHFKGSLLLWKGQVRSTAVRTDDDIIKRVELYKI